MREAGREREAGWERESEGGWERENEGGWESEDGRERVREAGRERVREEGRERVREDGREREGGKETLMFKHTSAHTHTHTHTHTHSHTHTALSVTCYSPLCLIQAPPQHQRLPGNDDITGPMAAGLLPHNHSDESLTRLRSSLSLTYTHT